MENASKALIIAGAILISILLISVGIMIFNGSSGLFNSATAKMSDQEKSMFNQEFTMYEGKRISGSQVRELLRKVAANNADSENPEITINNTEFKDGNVDKIPGVEEAKDAEIKNAYQYTIKTSDTSTANSKADGVISDISISRTSTSIPSAS